MKKEKTVKEYKRRTKSGKLITVRQHTATYEASNDPKKAVGSGKELKKKESIKERFDKAAAELASRPDPKDMTDEEVLKEWEELQGHWRNSKGHYSHYTERKMRNKDWSKRVNKLRKRYNEAEANQMRTKEDAKVKEYMRSRGITDDEVHSYAKSVGYTRNEETGNWHFRGSRVGHPYKHVVQKAVALRKKRKTSKN